MASRCQGDRGMATITGLVLVFAFTAGGVVWLARDANRSVSNRTAAQSIAFQAARSGAQQLGVASLREGAEVRVDADAARRAAESTAADLFSGYDVDGLSSASPSCLLTRSGSKCGSTIPPAT
jgi:uncharacterized membrane protein